MSIEFKPKKYEGTLEEVLSVLKHRDPVEYNRYINELMTRGISLEKIRECLILPEAQKILKESFLLQFEFQSHSDNGPERIMEYIDSWKRTKTKKEFALPIDMSNYLQFPEVKELLLREIPKKQEYDKRYKANSLQRFIESWKEVGVDLS